MNTATAFALETKSADTDEEGVAEVKTALEALTADIETKTKPVADLTERLAKLEAKANRPAAANDNKKTDDVEKKAFNSFIRTGAASLDEDEKKALNIGAPTAGGYVTAPEYSTKVIEAVTQFSPMRRLASVMSIGTGEVLIPKLTGDAAGGWVSETGNRPESQPAFGQTSIKAHEHAVTVPVSQQLLEDSFIDLQGFLTTHIGKRFGVAESAAFISGDGTDRPAGLFDAANTFEAIIANQDGSDIIAKLIELYYSLPSEYAMSATWGMNRKTMGVIRAAADTTTKGTLWSDGLADGTPARFLGAPVAEFPEMDDLASDLSGPPDTTPVVFGDFSYYQIVDRVGVQIMRDDYTGADNGIVKIRARRRVGGKVLLEDAFRVLTGSAA